MRVLLPVALAVVVSTAYWAHAQVATNAEDAHAQHQPKTDGAAEPADMAKHMQLMNKMMIQHLGEGDPQYDARFIDMMIPHHEGAVMMARHALKHSHRPELKAMAEKVIKDQQKEIEQLKQWRKMWYGDNIPAKEAAR